MHVGNSQPRASYAHPTPQRLATSLSRDHMRAQAPAGTSIGNLHVICELLLPTSVAAILQLRFPNFPSHLHPFKSVLCEPSFHKT